MMIYQDIIREFNRHKVKFVLVGGIALNLHGGNRATQDMDILVEMSSKNLTNAVETLTKLGYSTKLSVNPLDISKKDIRKSWIEEKNMKAFNFFKGEKSYEEVDIIIESPIDYETAAKDAKIIKIEGDTLPVISLRNLIKMKEVTGRDIDKMEIKALREIERLQNEG